MYKAFIENSQGTQTIYLNGQSIRGSWIEGDLLKIPCDKDGNLDYYIIADVDYRDTIYDIHRYAHKVIPETICEAVPDLTDANGQQVYIHDIVECRVIRNGGRWSNWEQIKNINHGKCRTLPMEVCYEDNPFGYVKGHVYTFRPTKEGQELIKEYEKPVGAERTRQHINWYNIVKEDVCAVLGNIFDKENRPC